MAEALPTNKSHDQATEKSNDPRFEAYLARLKESFRPRPELILINAPTFSFSAFNLETAKNRGYYAYPPTGLQCLRAAQKELGIETRIVDLNFEILARLSSYSGDIAPDLNELLRNILDEVLSPWDKAISAPLVGVSAGVTVSNIFETANHQYLQILRYLKDRQQFLTLSGGVIATNERQKLLDNELVHFVIAGEGENKLSYLLNQLFGGAALSPKPGIYFRDSLGTTETTGEKDTVTFRWNLVETYDGIPLTGYYKIGSLSPFSRMVGPDKPYATFQLARGCRGNCAFCGVTPFMGRGVRTYPVESVFKEIEYLVRERGIRHLEVLDDDFLGRPEAAKELLQRIIDSKVEITWAANNGLVATSLNSEMLDLLVQSGCVGFRIGIESGNEEMLRQIRKPATKPKLLQASRVLSPYSQLFVVGCYIIGFDDETNQQILDTFHFCLDLDLSWAGFSVYQNMREENINNEFETANQGEACQKRVIDFVPTKVYQDGILKEEVPDIHTIFSKDRGCLHNPKHLNEIWFAFNFLANYACNKYLRAGADPRPFLNWTRALILSHPANPVIRLFHGLGWAASGSPDRAEEPYRAANELVATSSYWQKRFSEYGLSPLSQQPPQSSIEVVDALQTVREKFRDILEH